MVRYQTACKGMRINLASMTHISVIASHLQVASLEVGYQCGLVRKVLQTVSARSFARHSSVEMAKSATSLQTFKTK